MIWGILFIVFCWIVSVFFNKSWINKILELPVFGNYPAEDSDEESIAEHWAKNQNKGE